jgi:CubicO group peptidase (beta-lactamase class C family)
MRLTNMRRLHPAAPRRVRRALLVAGLAASATLALPSALWTQTPAPTARLDSVFAVHSGTDRPGCAVSVVDGGRLVVARGYGMSDIGARLAISPNAIFHVASVSKQFTGMSLVLLARAGRLSLDDDVRKFLPELPAYDTPVTIRHMLTHTGGLRDQWNLLIAAGWRLGDDLITEQDVMEIVTRQRALNFSPGSDWLYSNSGFTLAAVIVKRVTGQSLRQFADSALFRPLGMHDTHFHDDNLEIVPGRTRGYTRRAGAWKETVPNYSTVGATSLFTTVADLARWQEQLADGTVGGRAAIEELIRPGVLTSGDTLRYALGIAHGNYRGVPTLSHSGGDPGYSSYLLHFPRTRSGVAVLCNTSGAANPTRLAEQTADVYLAVQLGPEPTLTASVPATTIAGAEGLYWSDAWEQAGRLHADSGNAIWTTGPASVRLRQHATGSWQLGAGAAALRRAPDGTLVLRTANGESAPFRRVSPHTTTPSELAALAGRYTSDELGVTYELQLTSDTLRLLRRKFPPVQLVSLFRDTFTPPDGSTGTVVRVLRDARGRVHGITVGTGRVRRQSFVRIPNA